MKKMKDSFKVSSKENGLESTMGMKAYPLHKQFAENGMIEEKYGENGMMAGSVIKGATE